MESRLWKFVFRVTGIQKILMSHIASMSYVDFIGVLQQEKSI